MIRSFPRKRESRVKYAGPSMSPWVPAFAGTSGIDVDSIPAGPCFIARGLLSRCGLEDRAFPRGRADDAHDDFLGNDLNRLDGLAARQQARGAEGHIVRNRRLDDL